MWEVELQATMKEVRLERRLEQLKWMLSVCCNVLQLCYCSLTFNVDLRNNIYVCVLQQNWCEVELGVGADAPYIYYFFCAISVNISLFLLQTNARWVHDLPGECSKVERGEAKDWPAVWRRGSVRNLPQDQVCWRSGPQLLLLPQEILRPMRSSCTPQIPQTQWEDKWGQLLRFIRLPLCTRGCSEVALIWPSRLTGR